MCYGIQCAIDMFCLTVIIMITSLKCGVDVVYYRHGKLDIDVLISACTKCQEFSFFVFFLFRFFLKVMNRRIASHHASVRMTQCRVVVFSPICVFIFSVFNCSVYGILLVSASSFCFKVPHWIIRPTHRS